jgi:hypothetical protein
MTLTSLLTVAVAVAFAPGCENHENFPQPLGVAAPPTVTNFSVTTPDNMNFDLQWEIDDPTGVQLYRIYFGVQGLGPPELETETTQTCPCTFPAALPTPISGTVWGVSVVTDENVEGAMATFVVE